MERVGQSRRVWRCGRARVMANSERCRAVCGALAARCATTKRCAADWDARTVARWSPEYGAFWPTSYRLAFFVGRVDVENLLEHSISRLPYTEWCSDYSFLSYARLSFVLNFWNFLSLPFPIDFLTVSAINSQYKIDQLKPFTYIVIIIYYRTRFSSFR